MLTLLCSQINTHTVLWLLTPINYYFTSDHLPDSSRQTSTAAGQMIQVEGCFSDFPGYFVNSVPNGCEFDPDPY